MRFCIVLLLTTFLSAADPRGPITPENVSQLKLAWTYDTGESPHVFWHKESHFETTPAYAEGKLYISTPAGLVIALDAATGREIWKHDLHVFRDGDFSEPTTRGVTLAGKVLYAATTEARLVCLSRDTGEPCPGFGSSGEVDLRAGLRRKPEYLGEYGVSSPPAIYKDLVIVGSYVADNSRAKMASGEVRAFDAKTGALRWTFHPLPADSPAGAANTWSVITVDQENGLVFLPTGSASPDYYGGLRPGDNRDADSIVALKGATGAVVWRFQTVHHDLWDYDVASPALLFPGKDGPAVAAGSKTGHLFLFDRLTGKPLFPIEERPVPRSDTPGEAASPTQPFPTLPPALVPQRITEKDLWGPTPQALEACKAVFHSLRNEGIFTPPTAQGSLIVPGNIGGLQWGGMVFDPVRRLLIGPVNRTVALVRLIQQADFRAAKKEHPDRETTEQTGAPYAMQRGWFESATNTPCVAPPWGELVAVSPDSGKIEWRVPLGGFGPDPDHPYPGSPNLGGPAVTSTGLIFIGASLDHHIRAFETAHGREVWSAELPTSARATPLIYTLPGGRQMVAVSAGGHDGGGRKLDSKVVAFALSDK
ncbi:MAG: pyrroloquinoline quinone-dependent dehydrogenase [Bryobacterales bacterium]|nr:pyrroloquinoline quinone-dependent dehydrogenase [Bryobacterales bacterium]MBV9400546.1 pyrroloquinoline quinone-dependent dehydrogenase [Bryobacterales bacterium]